MRRPANGSSSAAREAARSGSAGSGDDRAENAGHTGTAAPVANEPDRPPTGCRTSPGHRLLALLIGLLLLAPFVISAVRAISNDWIPTGDEAPIVIKTYDVFTGDPPLVGQPSTSELYGEGLSTFHPGPIEFWLYAVPLRLLGAEVAPLVSTAVINGGAVLVAAWVVLRRAGPGVAAWAAVILGGVTWSQGTAVLTDTISSNLGGFSFLAFATLAWALVAGDVRLLPLAVFAGTWTAQQHLSTVGLVAIIGLWATVGLVVALRRDARRGDGRGSRNARWIIGAVLLGLVLWAPVVIDELTGDPGNITAVFQFARDSTRPTLGARVGVDQALRAIGVPPLFTRSGLTGTDVRAGLSAPAVAGGLLVLTALVALVVWTRRRRTELSLLAATALVVTAAGAVTGANVPLSLEADRINLYRWVWTASTLSWLSVGWGLGLAAMWLLQRRSNAPVVDRPAGRFERSSRSVPDRVAAAVAVPVIVVLFAGAVDASVSNGLEDRRRDEASFDTYRRLGEELDDLVGDDESWLLVTQGSQAILSAGPALAAPLVLDGTEVQVEEAATQGYGEHRLHRPGSVDGVILVLSGSEPLRAPEGRQVGVVSLNAEFERMVQKLVDDMGDDPRVEVAPGGAELLRRQNGVVQAAMAGLEERLAEAPEEMVAQEFFLELVRDGYLTSPRFDPEDVERTLELARNYRSVWGDDHLGVWVLTPEEYADWAAGS